MKLKLDLEKTRRDFSKNGTKRRAPDIAFIMLEELEEARAKIAHLEQAAKAALGITHEAMRDHPEELINPCPCRWHRLQNLLSP